MRNLKKNMGRYLGMGMAVLLVLAALYLPQGWFALRDAAFQGRVQGEVLVPLTVAQLDRSYERDIYQRMCAYMEAYVQEDVNCSSKEIDPRNESLWENINQAESGMLMETLRGWNYLSDSEMKGWDSVIESCTQYALMRKSDGQILLVANDILLDKGDGCHMELLLDGVDGTIYYMESEENHSTPRMKKWLDDYAAWDWWWGLNATYHTEEEKLLQELYSVEEAESINENRNVMIAGKVTDNTGKYVEYYDVLNRRIYTYPDLWISSEDNREIYCCLLSFGQTRNSWTMETEAQDGWDYCYRLRLGLPEVVNSIPEMAERISLAEYDRNYDTEAEDAAINGL